MKQIEQLKKVVNELSLKICDLTGYGQALHPNDIKPDIEQALKQAISDTVNAMLVEEREEGKKRNVFEETIDMIAVGFNQCCALQKEKKNKILKNVK